MTFFKKFFSRKTYFHVIRTASPLFFFPFSFFTLSFSFACLLAPSVLGLFLASFTFFVVHICPPCSPPALRDASRSSRWPLGVNGGTAAWSLLRWWEHANPTGDGASEHGRLTEALPSSSSSSAAARGPGGPETRVNGGGWQENNGPTS